MLVLLRFEHLRVHGRERARSAQDLQERGLQEQQEKSFAGSECLPMARSLRIMNERLGTFRCSGSFRQIIRTGSTREEAHPALNFTA
jgi:hypothetical protein